MTLVYSAPVTAVGEAPPGLGLNPPDPRSETTKVDEFDVYRKTVAGLLVHDRVDVMVTQESLESDIDDDDDDGVSDCAAQATKYPHHADEKSRMAWLPKRMLQPALCAQVASRRGK